MVTSPPEQVSKWAYAGSTAVQPEEEVVGRYAAAGAPTQCRTIRWAAHRARGPSGGVTSLRGRNQDDGSGGETASVVMARRYRDSWVELTDNQSLLAGLTSRPGVETNRACIVRFSFVFQPVTVPAEMEKSWLFSPDPNAARIDPRALTCNPSSSGAVLFVRPFFSSGTTTQACRYPG